MERLFEQFEKKIQVYLATQTVNDPYSKETTDTIVTQVPIKGMVSELSAGSIGYKMVGIVTEKAMQLIVPKKYRTLLEKSYKIKIIGDTAWYEGYKLNGRMQVLEIGDFVKVYIYRKQV